MSKYIVPEPNEKEYMKETIRRIRLKHEAAYGKLPCPDPVPQPPLTKRNPNMADLLWANKWNLVRHFIIGGGGAALSTFTLTKDVTAAAGAFVIGGVLGVTRKGYDDLRRVGGKPDGLTALKNKVTRTKGDGMGIRSNVYEVKDELVKVGIILTDDIPNSQQLSEGMGAVLGVIKEGSDFKDIPQQERAKAIGHAFMLAGAEIYDKAVTYSDEV